MEQWLDEFFVENIDRLSGCVSLCHGGGLESHLKKKPERIAGEFCPATYELQLDFAMVSHDSR